MKLHAAILLIVILAALSISFGASAVAQQPGEVRITLFHDTHLHGNLESQGGITLAHYLGLIDQLRSELPTPANGLFVGNGDDVGPSLMSSVFRGRHTAEALSLGGLIVNTFGNHEFDFGPDNLLDVVRQAGYPYVTANVRDSRNGDAFGSSVGVRTWLIREVGGVRVGFTGLAPADTANIANVGPNVTILDPVEAMHRVVPEMRAARAQVVVLLSHLCGDETERLAALVDGIDVAVGDHCSRVLEQPRVTNGTIISRRGDEMRLVGQLDLYVIDGRVARFTYTQHTVRADGPAGESIATLIRGYKDALDAELLTEVGEAIAPLDATRDVVRGEESPAGNLVADALRAWRSSDAAIQNGGGIRGDRVFGPGVLLKRDIQEMLPFANYAVALQVSGQDLWAALENGVSRAEQVDGRFPQVSGIAFTWDPTAPAGSRVQEVQVGGGPLDLAARYTLATNDFMAGGGDGYDVLQNAEVLVPASAGPLLSNLVIDYIQQRGAVAAQVEGRIRIAP
jgi:5'-nucleotidase / UDP-sugar diphosphatase